MQGSQFHRAALLPRPPQHQTSRAETLVPRSPVDADAASRSLPVPQRDGNLLLLGLERQSNDLELPGTGCSVYE